MAPTGPPTRGDVEHLAEQVSGLRTAYDRYRKFLIAGAIIILALCFTLAWVWNVSQETKDLAQANLQNQVTSCQNANATRANQRLVWDFVLDLSAADGGPAEKAALESIRTWIHDVFAERDCSDLNKKYEIPVPPNVKQLLDQIEDDAD